MYATWFSIYNTAKLSYKSTCKFHFYQQNFTNQITPPHTHSSFVYTYKFISPTNIANTHKIRMIYSEKRHMILTILTCRKPSVKNKCLPKIAKYVYVERDILHNNNIGTRKSIPHRKGALSFINNIFELAIVYFGMCI